MLSHEQRRIRASRALGLLALVLLVTGLTLGFVTDFRFSAIPWIGILFGSLIAGVYAIRARRD